MERFWRNAASLSDNGMELLGIRIKIRFASTGPMIAEGKKRYEHPSMTIVNLEIAQMIATSGDVTVGGWGDGGSLGGGEAEESASRRGEWGNLWYNN